MHVAQQRFVPPYLRVRFRNLVAVVKRVEMFSVKAATAKQGCRWSRKTCVTSDGADVPESNLVSASADPERGETVKRSWAVARAASATCEQGPWMRTEQVEGEVDPPMIPECEWHTGFAVPSGQGRLALGGRHRGNTQALRPQIWCAIPRAPSG